MNCFIKMAVFVFSLLLPLQASAVWVNGVNIQYLYAGQAGNRYSVGLFGGNPNPGDMCPNSYDFSIEEENPKFKEIWALLLSAYMANKPVNIYLNGCGGHLDSPLITDVLLGTFP